MEFLSNGGVNALGDKLRASLSSGDRQGDINVPRSQYHDKETTLAESSRLRMALKKRERERDKLATEIKELCHG